LEVTAGKMSSYNEDFDLIKNFLEGDESSFNKIVLKYKEKIYWHARRMTGNHHDADEIVQEVLIVIFKKLKEFKFKSSLYTWIYRIVSTRSINLINKRKVRSFFSLDESEKQAGNKDIFQDYEQKEKFDRLEKILRKLPAKQREIFILRNFDELSYEEISEITRKSIGGLKANYFHALNKVMEIMKNYD
jgi:RNA polymerase sigma-70 factor (ECF subfamily)